MINNDKEKGLSSPNAKRSFCLLSTPKSKRVSIKDSKSPLLKNVKLKKSKRRECTPVYSPKASEDLQGRHPFTENKSQRRGVAAKLCFDEYVNNDQNFLNTTGGQPKKKFLALIEESLNEVGENYYGLLGNQTTPDTIFKNIFKEDEKEKTNEKNFRPPFVEEVLKVLNELRDRNFSETLKPMETRIITIGNDYRPMQVTQEEFFTAFLNLDFDLQNASFSQQNSHTNYFVPGKIALRNLEHSCQSRFLFEVGGSVRLSVIEIQLLS